MPFGETMAQQLGSNYYNSPYKFNGKELDEETGFYYYGARYYDPRISIWQSVDPLAEKYPDYSPYVYCGNDPINNIDPDGRYFVGINDKKVSFTLAKDGTIKLGKNASPLLKRLVASINSSGSKTAIAQIMKASQNETKIHTKIVKDKVNNGLLGLHQAHDKEGKPLKWDDKKGDFDGVPAYIEGKEGVYKEATITVFEGNIEESGGNGSYYGYDITISQEMANTFQHESNHDTDTEFIQDLKNKREGKTNKGVDSHDNIHPQEQKVYQEMQDSNKKKE